MPLVIRLEYAWINTIKFNIDYYDMVSMVCNARTSLHESSNNSDALKNDDTQVVAVSQHKLDDVVDIADKCIEMIDEGEVEGISEGERGACESVGIDLDQLESLVDLQVENQEQIG